MRRILHNRCRPSPVGEIASRQRLWKGNEPAEYLDVPRGLRVYTSRLHGRDLALHFHVGDNSSMKAATANITYGVDDALCVKGSGWN